VDWHAADRHLLAFAQRLSAFRKETPAVRHDTFLRGAPSPRTGRMDVTWHGARVGQPEFGTNARVLAMHLGGEYTGPTDRDVYVAVNAWNEAVTFELPTPPQGEVWRVMFDTSRPEAQESLPDVREYVLAAHSCVVLRSGG
jgi:glycogen operon protein